MTVWRAEPAAQPLRGEVRVPSDKSITHRALILGGLASGTTTIANPLLGEDTLSALRAMQALGAKAQAANEQIVLDGAQPLASPAAPIDCGNAGTLIRLLAGAVCGRNIKCVLDGDASLRRRPMRRIIEPLGQMGAQISGTAAGTAPLRIEPLKQLRGIEYTLPQASAQVKSAVLLAGLCAPDGAGVVEPLACRNHTELMLPLFGIGVEADGQRIKVAPGKLRAAEVRVPADISSAAFYLVAASIVPDSRVLLREVGVNPTRTGVINILRKMGAQIEMRNQRRLGREQVADLEVCHAVLHGTDLEAHEVPAAIDELPVICVAACCASGMLRLRGAAELRAKESDRLSAMSDALQALGAQVVEYDDGIDIFGSAKLAGGRVDSRGDHRIAMAMSVAALRAKDAVEIADCANVATSFPNFPQLAATVGWRIAQQEAA